MKKIFLLLLVAMFLPITAHATETDDTQLIIEEAQSHFDLLDRYVEDPSVNDVLILNLTPIEIRDTILNDIADSDEGFDSLLLTTDKSDSIYGVLTSGKANLEYTANRVVNITESLQEYITEYGSDIPNDKLLEFRDSLIQLKFIFADTFGDDGISKDRIYQTLRVDYK